jgi:hypothetical protein
MKNYSKIVWLCAAIIVCACQSTPRTEKVTLPAGGNAQINEIGNPFGDGKFIQLAGGGYTDEETQTRYHQKTTVASIDGIVSQTLQMCLVNERVPKFINRNDPDQVNLWVESKSADGTPLQFDIDAGVYQLPRSKKGYAPQSRQLALVPKRPITQLRKTNNIHSLRITTKPAGGQIFINGRKAGKAPLNTPSLEPGSYKLKAVKPINHVMRFEGEKTVIINKTGRHGVFVPLKKKRLFAKKWYSVSYAIRAEKRRYKKERVSNPVALDIRMKRGHHKTLSTAKKLAGQLNDVMRVGDRVRIATDTGQWLIWKRHHLLTPEFQAAVKAMQSGKTYTADPWSPGAQVSWTRPEINKDLVAQIAFGIQRKRNQWPHLFLRAHQLEAGSVKVFRSRADGPLALVAQGGKNLSLDSSQIKLIKNGSLFMATTPSGDRPLQISWSRPPERILVIAEHSPNLKPIFFKNKLRPQEKKIIDLGVRHVTALTRLTSGPDYKGWYRQHLEPDGLLADRIDLGKDEIGPHDTQGQYTRIWLVRFKLGATTQRQMETNYVVSGSEKKFTSDNFIRRRN